MKLAVGREILDQSFGVPLLVDFSRRANLLFVFGIIIALVCQSRLPGLDNPTKQAHQDFANQYRWR